jgi:hypothetical protein
MRKHARPPTLRWTAIAFVASTIVAGSGLACNGVEPWNGAEPPPSTPTEWITQRHITLRYTEACGDAGPYCTTRAARISFVRAMATWCEDGGTFCAPFDRDDPEAP